MNLRRPFGSLVKKMASAGKYHPDYSSIIYKAATLMVKEKIEGDYFEFGVWEGRSFSSAFWTIRHIFRDQEAKKDIRSADDLNEMRRLWANMRFYAFDSFSGLPELKSIDRTSKIFRRGQYCCAKDKFSANIKSAGVQLDKVVAVEGPFDATCREFIRAQSGRKAAIVHIDCDLYESTKPVLELVGTLLVDGTVLIFDDWYFFRGSPFYGEQRAFREWQESLKGWHFTEYQKEGPYRNSFIANAIPQS